MKGSLLAPSGADQHPARGHGSAVPAALIVAVLGALAGHRFPLEDEKATQAAMHEALVAVFGQGVQREVRIMGGIVDFLVVPSDAHTASGAWTHGRRAEGDADAASQDGRRADAGAQHRWASEARPLIAIEVKLKGSARDIVRQVRGYCWEPALAGLVLATAKPVHLGPTLAGKPVAVLDLGRAWL